MASKGSVTSDDDGTSADAWVQAMVVKSDGGGSGALSMGGGALGER